MELLLGNLPKLSIEDRVNLLSDAWALVQAGRAPVSLYFGLVEKLPASTDLAEREQIIDVTGFINRLLIGSPQLEEFRRYAQSLYPPTFKIAWVELKAGKSPGAGSFRASLISALGDLNDPEMIARCRKRFRIREGSASLAPDLRVAVLKVVGRYADEKTWNMLHELGVKTTSIEEKQNYYNALTKAVDPRLIKKTLPIALTDELPTSRAVFFVAHASRARGVTPRSPGNSRQPT